MFVQEFDMFKSYLICCFCVRGCSQECKHILIYSTKLFDDYNQVLLAGACRQLRIHSRCHLKSNSNKHSANRGQQQSLIRSHLINGFFAASSGSQLSQWDPVHKGGRVPLMAALRWSHMLSIYVQVGRIRSWCIIQQNRAKNWDGGCNS